MVQDFTGTVGQAPVRVEHLILVARVQRVHEVQIALHKLQEHRLSVHYECHRHGVEVGQTAHRLRVAAHRVVFEVVVVATHHELHPLLPVLEAEGSRAAGVRTEVLAPAFHNLARHHRAVHHAHLPEKRGEGVAYAYRERGVVVGPQGVQVAENPCSGRRHGGVRDAPQAVHEVVRRHTPRGRLVEHHVVAQREGVAQTVGADAPPLGNAGLHLQGGVELNQAVV